MGRGWPDWIWQKYELVVSPSQIQTYTSCPRRWWFIKQVKIPEGPTTPNLHFGTCLHSVCERYLKADDQGRVDGNPVNLYPKGWEFTTPKYRVPRHEASQIKQLIDAGISTGTLRRLPHRVVEDKFVREVMPGVAMIGIIDQAAYTQAIIEDHKTTSSRRYALGSESLAKDPKMLCYAYHSVRQCRLDEIQLRLNYFSKNNRDDPRTWWVEALVQTPDVVNFWETEIVPVCEEMLALKRAGVDPNKWGEVEGPRETDACNKYNQPCPASQVCGGLKTVAMVKRMGVFNKSKSAGKSKAAESKYAGKSKAAESKSEKKSEKKSENSEVQSAPPASPAPPWAQEGCNACKGTGVSSKNEPCRACDLVSSRKGGPTSKDCVWHVADDGTFLWESPEETVVEEIKETVVEETQADDRDPLHGFTLFINCLPAGERFIDLHDVLDEEMREYASDAEVASYYEANSWDRKDALASQAGKVAAQLTGNVVAIGGSQDFKSYLDAIRPHAQRVILGVFA